MQIPSIHLKARAAAGKQILANSSASSSPGAEGEERKKKKEDEKVERLYKKRKVGLVQFPEASS